MSNTSDLSYKACLHAAIENPSVTHFSQAQAVCSALTADGGIIPNNRAVWDINSMARQLGPGGERQYFSQGLPYVPATSANPLANELSSPFQSSGGVLWRDNPNEFNQMDPFGTAAPLFTYSNARGGRFSQFYTNGLF